MLLSITESSCVTMTTGVPVISPAATAEGAVDFVARPVGGLSSPSGDDADVAGVGGRRDHERRRRAGGNGDVGRSGGGLRGDSVGGWTRREHDGDAAP